MVYILKECNAEVYACRNKESIKSSLSKLGKLAKDYTPSRWLIVELHWMINRFENQFDIRYITLIFIR